MLQTYLLIHNLFFFSLIILYHVLSMFLSIWEECVRSIYYSFYRINTRLCIESFCLFVRNFCIKILLFIAFCTLIPSHCMITIFYHTKDPLKTIKFIDILCMYWLWISYLKKKLLQVIHLKDIEYFTGH